MTDEELVQTLIGEVLTQYEADSILKSIGNLKSENDELKSRLTHATEECLKWHERAQNLLKDSGGSISGYEKKISDLQSENAALRERLKKAVELPCKVGDKVYIPWVWDNQSGIMEAPVVTIRLYPYVRKYEIRLETDSLTFAQKYQYGNFNDKDFGTLIFTTPEAAEARLKELQGGKK